MRKITIATLTVLILGTAQANYTVKIPLEQAQGGSLPSGSIQFKNSEPNENWQPYAPTYTEWVMSGEIYDCTNWTPDPSTVTVGESFTQTANDCKQDETRTRQDREQETTTLEIRNVGTPVEEVNVWEQQEDERDAIGTREETWEAIADARGLSKNWNSLHWFDNTITHLPSLPYPVTNAYSLTISATQIEDVGGLIGLTNIEYLGLYNNNLKNVNGLINLRSLTNLTLHNNSLTNINGLANLTEVTNTLSLNNNQLTEVDSLINLQIVGFLNLGGNPLNNINGLANIVLTQRVFITNTYSGPKLPANSRFCTLNTEARFPVGASKSQLCETS